jgi:hypothetical protein
MQLHTDKYEWNFSVLWLFLATVACYLNRLSARSLHTHSEHWQNLQIFSFFVKKNATHYTPSASVFHHNCREAYCFQATPTLLKTQQYVCITLHYQHFSLNIVSPFPFPHNAVQKSLTTYININKGHSFLQLVSEISGMNCQGHPSNWNRNTTENVRGCSGQTRSDCSETFYHAL